MAPPVGRSYPRRFTWRRICPTKTRIFLSFFLLLPEPESSWCNRHQGCVAGGGDGGISSSPVGRLFFFFSLPSALPSGAAQIILGRYLLNLSLPSPTEKPIRVAGAEGGRRARSFLVHSASCTFWGKKGWHAVTCMDCID